MRAPANSNASRVAEQSPSCDLAEAARLRLEDARRFYAEESVSAVETALRASPDFAATFAEPGEMEQRLRAEDEFDSVFLYYAFVVVLIVGGACVAAVIGYMIARGGL